MKPLYLEMTAFGSYAVPTAVPFEALDHGLYLVTGDTGAGKTTIFDAVMFALYGMPSGEERSVDMLHCDHVPKSTDTVVSLRFSQNGKEYTVKRSLHYPKKRGSEEYGDPRVDALLEEPDRAPTEGALRVTARCEEILGLNAQQFRKIIMLAQGEFREFLKADSDKKNEILGKLFDNSAYLRFQNLLSDARDTLRTRRSARTEELRSLIENGFSCPTEGGGRFLSENPDLIENLERLSLEDTAQWKTLCRSRDAVQERLNQLNESRGAAEAVNAQLNELENLRTHLSTLEQREDEVRERRERMICAERALHKALPAIRRFEQANDSMNAALAEIERLRSELLALSLAAEEAQVLVDADASRQEEHTALAAELRTIEEQLPGYRELERREAEKLADEKRAAEAKQVREEGARRLEELSAGVAELRQSLEELQGADAELEIRRRETVRAEERLAALAGKNGLREERQAILRAEEEKDREHELLLRLTAEAQEASDRHAELYRCFVAGQAGLLAGELRAELAERGEASCPVCGTRLTRERMETLPLPAEDTPDRKTVEAARAEADRLEKKRSEQHTITEKLGAAIQSQKDSLLARAAALLPGCTDWDRLCEEGYLTAAIAEAEAGLMKAQTAQTAAQERQQRLAAGRKKLPEKEAAERELREQIRAAWEREAEQNAAAQAAATAVREMKKQLRFESESAALQAGEELKQKLNAMESLLRAHQETLAEAKRLRDTCRGNLQEKNNRLERLTAEQAQMLSAMDQALSEAGFASPAEAERALLPVGGDGEAWLREEQRELDDFESDKRHSREQICRLEQLAEGKQPVDLTELSTEIAEEKARLAAANESCVRQEKLLDNHRTVLDRARQIRKELAATDTAWKRLEKLGNLAVGVNSESGRLSFDRYVMGAVFREILEMANRRMDRMSGGRYELVHKTGADRRNAKAGLEIEVLDNNTGLLRPSGSLSGGEAFFTSLSLALGLSDVVQNHAGGKQMEALFIDEGFGTLSDDVLDRALEVLNQLTEGKRLVGIISHVDKLDESIPQKIRVNNSERGSSLTMELA